VNTLVMLASRLAMLENRRVYKTIIGHQIKILITNPMGLLCDAAADLDGDNAKYNGEEL
jgi:hypothetical protein